MPEISIKAEPIFEIFGFTVTNSYIASIIVIIVTFFIFIYYKSQTNLALDKRSYFFYLIHFVINSIYSLFKSIIGDKINSFFPLVGAFFVYILLQNWFGLIPGVGSVLIKHVPLLRGATADLNLTLALGIISIFLVQYYGIKYLGFKDYIRKYINTSSPINFAIGLLDIVSELSRILSFSFRLFGNIFAGEVLLMIIAFLIPVLAPFPFLVLEVFVGFIQALVFAMLTAVFINLAVTKHH